VYCHCVSEAARGLDLDLTVDGVLTLVRELGLVCESQWAMAFDTPLHLFPGVQPSGDSYYYLLVLVFPLGGLVLDMLSNHSRDILLHTPQAHAVFKLLLPMPV